MKAIFTVAALLLLSSTLFAQSQTMLIHLNNSDSIVADWIGSSDELIYTNNGNFKLKEIDRIGFPISINDNILITSTRMGIRHYNIVASDLVRLSVPDTDESEEVDQATVLLRHQKDIEEINLRMDKFHQLHSTGLGFQIAGGLLSTIALVSENGTAQMAYAGLGLSVVGTIVEMASTSALVKKKR